MITGQVSVTVLHGCGASCFYNIENHSPTLLTEFTTGLILNEESLTADSRFLMRFPSSSVYDERINLKDHQKFETNILKISGVKVDLYDPVFICKILDLAETNNAGSLRSFIYENRFRLGCQVKWFIDKEVARLFN